MRRWRIVFLWLGLTCLDAMAKPKETALASPPNQEDPRFRLGPIKIGDTTTFTSVQKRLGAAIKSKKSYGGSEPDHDQICYRIGGKRGGSQVSFESGPMGGWNSITSFTLQSQTEGVPDCVHPKTKDALKKTGDGIYVGIPKDQFLKIVKLPLEIDPDDGHLKALVTGPESKDFSVVIFLEARFVGNRLTYYHILRAVSG
jgi:hypothetical protein